MVKLHTKACELRVVPRSMYIRPGRVNSPGIFCCVRITAIRISFSHFLCVFFDFIRNSQDFILDSLLFM